MRTALFLGEIKYGRIGADAFTVHPYRDLEGMGGFVARAYDPGKLPLIVTPFGKSSPEAKVP